MAKKNKITYTEDITVDILLDVLQHGGGGGDYDGMMYYKSSKYGDIVVSHEAWNLANSINYAKSALAMLLKK